MPTIDTKKKLLPYVSILIFLPTLKNWLKKKTEV